MKYSCENGVDSYGTINRETHPKWPGWKIIDDYKKSHLAKDRIDQLLQGNSEFQSLLQQVS